ncbi:MAG: acyltransferase family protein [Gemmatimonadaceae bacterium]
MIQLATPVKQRVVIDPAQERSTEGAASVQPRDHRLDIQGLRAVAVLVVALGHANVQGMKGGYVGVDVFFVISGFLITGWLVRRGLRADRMPFRDFYAGRARRILPLAALNTIVTVIVTSALLNPVRALAAYRDSIWATFFSANVYLARMHVDYFDSTRPASPFQHYWSLAVEEQFYLLWPAIILGVLYVVRRRARRHADHQAQESKPAATDDGFPVVRRLGVVVLLLVAISFGWSVQRTAIDQDMAYFSTFTRSWELGIGSLVAIGTTRLVRVPAAWRAALGWIGMAAIIASVLMFTAATDFPGYAAALPVLGAAAVLIGGLRGGHRWGVDRVLQQQPLTLVGDASYSFYLWHWPVLVIAAQYAGHPLGVGANVGLLIAAFAVSVVTYRYYEHPLHHGQLLQRPSAALTVWPVAIAAGLVVAIGGIRTTKDEMVARFHRNARVAPPFGLSIISGGGRESAEGEIADSEPAVAFDPVAAVVAASAEPSRLISPVPNGLTPPLFDLKVNDYVPGRCGASRRRRTSADVCHTGAGDADRTVVVFGDSHAKMWMPALLRIAGEHRWDIVPMFKEGCTAAGIDWGGGLARGARAPCVTWYSWALDQLKVLRPDVIILSEFYTRTLQSGFGGGAQGVYAGLEAQLRALVPLGARTVVFEDIPYQDQAPADCLTSTGSTIGTCSTSIDQTLASAVDSVRQLVETHGARFFPTSQWFCASGRCPVIIGSTIAYRDQSHMSPVYAIQLSRIVGNRLAEAIGPRTP